MVAVIVIVAVTVNHEEKVKESTADATPDKVFPMHLVVAKHTKESGAKYISEEGTIIDDQQSTMFA